MHILVMGGSYFLGKSFVSMAREKHHITVFNRGNRSLPFEDVVQIQGDRHKAEDLGKLAELSFDAVVDFCAYQKGDIAFLLEYLKYKPKQYIFISTCDVYAHGTGQMQNEEASLEQIQYGGDTGEYITGKVALEQELLECREKYGFAYTSLRPAMIYGPDNYAPREGMYFHWIENAGQVLHPTDATGEFQMVYVEDVALAILKAVGNEGAYNQIFNLAAEPIVTYESFAKALEVAEDKEFTRIPVTIDFVIEKNIPLPFPLTKEESNLYEGRKALRLIGQYTSLEDGLRRTICHK